VTRAREQGGALRSLLEAEGAEVHSLPLLDIGPPDDPAPLDAALSRLGEFAWVVFTSPNAVSFTFDGLGRIGGDARSFGGTRIAAVGGATAEALRQRGLEPDLVPEAQSAAGLIAAFTAPGSGHDLRREQVLIPASSIGRTELDEGLAARGAIVVRVTAYENRPPSPDSVTVPAALTESRLDGVVFASPSAARNFLDVVGAERGLAWLRAMDIAVIGPTTAAAVRDLGLEVAVQPEDSSVPALVRALCAHYGRR
jgi:uroporphyrinogen-III synthase